MIYFSLFSVIVEFPANVFRHKNWQLEGVTLRSSRPFRFDESREMDSKCLSIRVAIPEQQGNKCLDEHSSSSRLVATLARGQRDKS